ncbi:MAG TPA: pyrroline-5-carboxylate reductase [Xanthobacteraceae bacterium]|nr:pyrroline-5-carboxylate reductase [Xanthobacteraceae bacterium]
MNQTTLRDLSGTLILAGAGKMGSAMLDGWIAHGLDPAVVVVLEPQPSLQVARYGSLGLRLNPKPDALRADAIVIAVKPQVAPEVMPGLTSLIGPVTVVVSIMAGRSLAFLQSMLPPATSIVRAMPNTPAAIGRGMTVAIANAHVTSQQKSVADRLLTATGAVEWVADETMMDAVTALSGSGPAYVFLLAEALTHAGVAVGLPKELAERLARATIAGSGELLNRASDDAATLRRNVTSPGGTTAAALEVLMSKDGLEALMEKAIAAATRRSRELDV